MGVNNIYEDTCLQACFWRCQFMNYIFYLAHLCRLFGRQAALTHCCMKIQGLFSVFNWSIPLSVIRFTHTCTNSEQLSTSPGRIPLFYTTSYSCLHVRKLLSYALTHMVIIILYQLSFRCTMFYVINQWFNCIACTMMTVAIAIIMINIYVGPSRYHVEAIPSEEEIIIVLFGL